MDIEQNTPEWFRLRLGKVTGSKLKSLGVKIGVKTMGYYQLLAERLAIEEEFIDPDETPAQRGHRLEPEAIAAFEKLYKKKVDRVGFCLSDKNSDIALSPDGFIMYRSAYRWGVEVKCLSSAKHLKVYLTQKVPTEYMHQAYQYFIVNEKLQRLHFVFYDNRLPDLPIHVIEINRSDILDEIKDYEHRQLHVLSELETIATMLKNNTK